MEWMSYLRTKYFFVNNKKILLSEKLLAPPGSINKKDIHC